MGTDQRDRRRVHLPLAAREPAVAEGTRSLARWAKIRDDLQRHPELRTELERDPAPVLARYGIRGTDAELAAIVAGMLGLRITEP